MSFWTHEFYDNNIYKQKTLIYYCFLYFKMTLSLYVVLSDIFHKNNV